MVELLFNNDFVYIHYTRARMSSNTTYQTQSGHGTPCASYMETDGHIMYK